MHHPILSFSVHILQGIVDLAHLRGQGGKVSADIRGHLFLAMDALVFLDVLGHFFGHGVVVPEQVAEEGCDQVAFLVGWGCFHKLGR